MESLEIKKIYLSLEIPGSNGFDISNENTDVIVVMEDGKKYIASFFTYANIEKLRREHQQTGEYLFGKYFRAENMVLIEKCTQEAVREIVEHMIDEGDFYMAFRGI